jgi:hypothetical protein
MAATFNSASTAGQGMQLLGTNGSLNLLLGSPGMTLAGESMREGYGYSIDSWPKAMQEQFMNEGEHLAESKRTAPPPQELLSPDPMDATALHLAEFFDCVRSRKPPSEPPEVGHHAAAAGHMVNLSYRSGKKLFWDAEKGIVKT